MNRKPIHRGGILSAGYDPTRRWLDVEFDTHRVLRCENVGPEVASSFLRSASPFGYWKDEIEENYVVREISRAESEKERPIEKKGVDALKAFFGE